MKTKFIFLFIALTTVALASSTTLKQIDNIQNSTGGSSLAVPGTGSSFATDSNTLTLSNKSISGSTNTFSNIPASAVSSGQLSVANGGTGASSLTLNGMLYGNGTSPIGATSAGSQYQVFQAGSGGVPTVGALQLNQSAAVSGSLGVANGGTGLASLTAHYTLIGNGTSSVTLVSPSTAGYVLTSNGGSADPSYQPPSVGAPALNGSQASPQTVTAAGGISLTGISYSNMVFVVSNSGSVTVTATPSITACTAAGQALVILGESASNVIVLQDESGLSGSKLHLNGNWTSGLNSILSLICDGNGFWIEKSRAN